jgi:ureidoacrylate peracid hydrolase
MTGGRHGARLGLLLIDCQVDFASPQGAMARAGRDLGAVPGALANVAALLAGSRAHGLPLVFVRLASSDLCVPGQPGSEFFGIAPGPGELVVTKPRFSAFTGTGLAATLKEGAIDTLILAGLTTECCVASTAWHALEEEFAVTVAADACAAYDMGLHRATLRALGLSGVKVAQTCDILARINKYKQ